jgi:hypothetical protein
MSNRNYGPNTEEHELFMIETVMACSKAVMELKQTGISSKTKLFENARNFTSSFTKLWESAAGIKHSGTMHNNSIPTLKVFRNNRYAYFREVSSLLLEHSDNDPEGMKLLNESIVSLAGDSSYDFEKFREDLLDCIRELESVDDFSKYDTCLPEILRIKILARKPLYVLGFDVINSPVLRDELKNSFGIDIMQAFGTMWDRTNKQLLFPFKGRLVAYDVASNRLGDYNEVNSEKVIDPFTGEKLQCRYIDKLTIQNYRKLICDEVNQNMVQIWFNFDAMDVKFTDNLYGDASRAEFLKKNKNYSDKSHFVKQPSVDVPSMIIDEPRR